MHIDQHVLGAKVRIYGDLIYNQAPQISLGLQYKKNRDIKVPYSLGAGKDEGLDYYVSASKLLLGGFWGHNLLLNGTMSHNRQPDRIAGF